MNFQGIILGVLVLSFLGNIFSNNVNIVANSDTSYNITEVSYSDMNTLDNITKILIKEALHQSIIE